jgi:hypothetical protein
MPAMSVFQSAFSITAWATPKPQQSAAPLDKLTPWDMLWMCGEFAWPFIILTAAGAAVILIRFFMEYRQKLRAYSLLALPIEYANLARLVKVLNVSQPSRAAALFQQMITVFNKTRSAEILQSDIGSFVQTERSALEGFNRMLGFLSGTAAALGWVGSLWGVFVMLYGGNAESQASLRGLSGALIPALAGQIISWVFQLSMVSLHFISHRHLKITGERAEELRQALMQLQLRPAQRAEKLSREATTPKARPTSTPEPVVVSEEEVEGWR